MKLLIIFVNNLLPIPFYQYTHNWLTDWRTERCRLKWSTAWSKLPRPEKNKKSVWRSRYQNELELEARSLQPSALFAVCHPPRLLLKRFQIRGNSRAGCMFHSDEQMLLLLVVPRNKKEWRLKKGGDPWKHLYIIYFQRSFPKAFESPFTVIIPLLFEFLGW